MRDFIYLCIATPFEEKCAQVGQENYLTNARIEAQVYVNQLLRIFGENPSGTRFKIIECPHDFGIYLDILFHYDHEDQLHIEYMSNMESGCANWDTQSRKELVENHYDISTKVIALPIVKSLRRQTNR